MAIMLEKAYAAFKAAGVSDAEAQAAEELADYENRVAKVAGKLSVRMWAAGINAAAAIATSGMLWQVAPTIPHLTGLVGQPR